MEKDNSQKLQEEYEARLSQIKSSYEETIDQKLKKLNEKFELSEWKTKSDLAYKESIRNIQQRRNEVKTKIQEHTNLKQQKKKEASSDRNRGLEQ